MLSSRKGDTAPSPAAAAPSGREIASLLYRLLRSQTPWHRQVDEPVPAFADEWLAGYDQGRDVVDWYAR